MARKKKSNGQLWVMLALIVIIIAVIVLLPSCGNRSAKGGASQSDSTTLVKVGDPAPDFSVALFDGSHLTLSELRGKVVLLNFWATWCPPCREELSHVQQQVIDRLAGEEFVFLPISRGEERAAVEAFRAKTGYAFPMGLDTDETIYKRYATRFIPRNFLIDRTGRVVKATVGYDDEEFAELLCAAAAEIQQK